MERPDPGAAIELEPGVRMVLAPNPGPMTHWGTNTWLVGWNRLVVIDPGPLDPAHLDALHRAIGRAMVSHVLVTHAHRDHSPLAERLARGTGSEVYAFGDASSGRNPVMEQLAASGLAGGGEGVDAGFSPDRKLADEDLIDCDGWQIKVHHTPGHFASHLSFSLGDALFAGDHVMAWASSLVSPPDGDLAAFMETSIRLRARNDRVIYAGHGEPVTDPAGRLDWLIAHRNSRNTAILAALRPNPITVPEITARVYRDIPPAMLPAAERNVLAHLIDLVRKGEASAHPCLSLSAGFSRG